MLYHHIQRVERVLFGVVRDRVIMFVIFQKLVEKEKKNRKIE
jgi:hypothetical protein